MTIINELQLSKDLIRFPSVTPEDAGAIKFLSKKLKKLGKKPVKFNLKNEFRKPSKILIKNKKEPRYKKVLRLVLSGFKKLILDIISPE